MRLHLVRHPKPSIPGDAGEVCYGSTDLTVSDHENVRVLGLLIQVLPTKAPAILFSSPLQRCAALARQLSEERHWPAPTFDARLAELDFGYWEMQRWSNIPRPEIDAWANAMVDYRPGGGESVTQMAVRVGEFYRDLQQRASERQPQSEEVIVMCHAGTIRLLLACQKICPRPADLFNRTVIVKIAQQAAGTPHAIGYGEVVSLSLE
ncbi:histidine phosphatase family protein [Glaciimonas immobilis]|uniref:Alpha-ribazole phosphatase n=1 Tax=Glaciimonas immobilis TaxID=728004 RepID=A0A840RU19_9BURK|nr:histidine phosphatase family protein [Glaciimonas immobilis]KAF3996750.1 phosphoglycerate mutase [Glaciimonas immobilis]MBB5201325.1 alpha-ribazole phosphatase [Glaciimonas immobilis]